MKAWELTDETGESNFKSLVFADTAGKAKMQAFVDSPFLYHTTFEIPYVKVGVRRFKAFDNCENVSEKEICLKLIKDWGYWFEIGFNFYDENNIADFEKIWGVE